MYLQSKSVEDHGMDVNLTVDKENNLRKFVITGTINKNMLLGMLSKLYADPDFQPEMHTYCDLSKLKMTAFTIEDIEEVANFVKKNRAPAKQYKVALYAPDALSNILSRIYRKEFEENSTSSVMVFKQEQEAMKWLAK